MSASRLPPWLGKYVGIPFADDGHDFTGCHCWGLVHLVLKNEASIIVSTYDDYDANDLLAAARNFRSGATDWRAVEDGCFRCFDCVLMMAMSGVCRVAAHVGILVSPTRVLHVWKETAAIHMPLDHIRIRNRIVGVYRHPDLNS